MTTPEALDAIKSLLLTIPSVTFAMVVRNTSHAQVLLRFRCNQIDALKPIARASVAANVSFRFSDPHEAICGETHLIDRNDLPFEAYLLDDDNDPTTNSEVFGLYLAEELEDLRLITAHERKRLHTMWNVAARRI